VYYSKTASGAVEVSEPFESPHLSTPKVRNDAFDGLWSGRGQAFHPPHNQRLRALVARPNHLVIDMLLWRRSFNLAKLAHGGRQVQWHIPHQNRRFGGRPDRTVTGRDQRAIGASHRQPKVHV